jgi:glyoxylase-like metal-dependent hydrolase (beta-lactamase superfamily II)
MHVEPFFDPRTWTLTFVVWDEATRDAVIIDPVLDYDANKVSVSEQSVDRVLDYVRRNELKVHFVLETHAHADHLTGAAVIKRRVGAKVGIGENIRGVQGAFSRLFDMDVPPADEVFDVLLGDGDKLVAGSLTIETISTPGHTPACVSYVVGDAVFTGDALFMPDYGTGRCDFPGGSAEQLYDSVQKLYRLPDETRVFVGHDYQPGGREVRWETTIGESKRSNKQLRGDTPKADFVKFRTERDATLALPNLIFQSLQVNILAGELPKPAQNGRRYLKMPLNVFG